MDPLIGMTLLGRYEVLKRIGSGGMGAVYVAKQTAIGRSVALKVLRSDLMSNEHVRERFRREAEIIAKLRHPNTIQLIDYGETEDGMAVMAMELLVGKTLNERLKETGPLSLVEALDVGIDVASSLAEAHLIGLVHRDLKPANIFLVEVAGQTHAKVLDFGIARILDEEATRLTSTGQVFGTPRYMSPEQAMSTGEVDSRSDIYSLGLIIYECIVGQPPFVAQTSIQYLSAHSSMPPPKLRSHYTEAPEVLEQLIDACLAKEPADRPQTAEEIVNALSAIKRLVQSGGAMEPIVFARSASQANAPAAPQTSPPGSAATIPAGGTTRVDDQTLVKPKAPATAKKPPAMLFAAAALLVLAALSAGAYVYFTEKDYEIVDAPLDAGARVEKTMPDAAAIAVVAPAAGDAGQAEEATTDAGQLAEETAPDAAGELAEKPRKGRRKKDKGPLMTQQGDGVITGPASMVLPTDDEGDSLRVIAKRCKESELKGSAQLTLKGCPKNCAIVIDEKCGGRTPAENVAVPPGFHTVSVICGSRVELTKQHRFPADEGTELRCR